MGNQIEQSARPQNLVENAVNKNWAKRALEILNSGIVEVYRISVEVPFTYAPESYNLSTQNDGVLSLFEQRVWDPYTQKNAEENAGLIIIVQETGDDPELKKAMQRERYYGETRAVLIYTREKDSDFGQAINVKYKIGQPLTPRHDPVPEQVIATDPSLYLRPSSELVSILLDRIEHSQRYQDVTARQQMMTA